MRLRTIASAELSRRPSLLSRRQSTAWHRRPACKTVSALALTSVLLSAILTTISHMRRRPRVAVCLAGNARTFRLNFTHDSIRQHVIDVLEPSYDTDVFFVISLDDPPRGQLPVAPREDNATLAAVAKFHPVHVRLLDARTDVLRTLRVRRIFRDRRPPIDVLRAPPGCAFTPGANGSIRVAHTLLRARQCAFDIGEREKRTGMRYHWVYRLRPDVALLQDVPLPSQLRRDVYYSNQGRTNVTAALGAWWAARHAGRAAGASGSAGRAVADQVGIMSREVAEVALRAFEASDDCELYAAPFLPLPEEVLRFWLLKHDVRYSALPFDWVIVRERVGLECFRMFHQFGRSADGRAVDWRRSIRKCLVIGESLRHHFPDMAPLQENLLALDAMTRLPNEITTT